MIVPMKKAEIAVLAEDREALLAALQKSGCLMLVKSADDATSQDTSAEETLVARAEKSLKLLEKYESKKKTAGRTVAYTDFVRDDADRIGRLRAVEADEEELTRLHADILTFRAEIQTLAPWQDLGCIPAQLGRRGSVVMRAGFVPPAKFAVLAAEVETAGAGLEVYGLASEGSAVVIATFIDDDAAAFDAFRAAGFAETILPAATESVAALITAKKAGIAAAIAAIAAIENRLRGDFATKAELGILSDRAATVGERKKAPVTSTPSTAFIQGWVRIDRIDRLRAALTDATEVFELDLSDPAEDETPPTAVKNNKFVTAFETITDMFAKPSYNEIDPNPVMSFWYWMLFGMMMADFGYGILMIVLFAFLIKKMRAKGETRKLLQVLMYSGVTTAIWGVLFNSYFGASIPWMASFQILAPMDEALKFLVLSLVVGVLHIFTGLVMKAANNIRKKDYLAVFADSLSWMLFIAGIGMLFLPGFAAVGKWLAIAGAAIIVLFAGRSNKNPFARIGSGLYALYGATGFLGDIMSYARILALALSSAVIAYVMNMLAGMIQGSVIGFILSLVVYLVGHLFNLVMGLLSAYVHTSRLQFIEFFTKFYDGSGYEFKPLAFKMKYIDQINEEK